jgi:hypothetical protein
MIDTPLKKLTYRKTPTVKNIDDLIKKKCDGLREGYMQALETHNANLNEFAKKINTITYSIADNRGILKARMDRLEQMGMPKWKLELIARKTILLSSPSGRLLQNYESIQSTLLLESSQMPSKTTRLPSTLRSTTT